MRKTRIAGFLIAAAAVLLLSGCVRFQADLTVSPDNTLHGDIVVAAAVGESTAGDDAGAKESARARASDVERQLLPNLSGADGVTRTSYDKDGYVGSRFSLRGTPIAALNSTSSAGALQLVRDGDEFVFSGRVDFTPGSDQAPTEGSDESNITVAITFPGTVTEHNGKLDGTKVSWTTSFEGGLDMHARASAEPLGPTAWLWVLIGWGILGLVAVLLLVIGAVIVLRVLTSNRRSTQAPPEDSLTSSDGSA